MFIEILQTAMLLILIDRSLILRSHFKIMFRIYTIPASCYFKTKREDIFQIWLMKKETNTGCYCLNKLLFSLRLNKRNKHFHQ